MAIRSLAYIVVESADLERWRAFACGVMGMEAATESDDARLLLRMDGRPFRLAVHKGEAERFVAAGWQYASKAAYEAGIAKLASAGVALETASKAEAKSRHLSEYVRCADPSGNRLEIGWGNVLDFKPFVSPVAVSGFVTDGMGMGHVVLPALKLAETRAFYVDLLGFGDSDEARFYFQGGGDDDPGIGFYFLHCDNPRHHSVALGEFPAASGSIHMMVEVRTLDDVGRALDRAMAADVPISATLGKHSNDEMVSFYMKTPGGFDVEYGSGAITPDWKTFEPTVSLKESLWGHRWAAPEGA